MKSQYEILRVPKKESCFVSSENFCGTQFKIKNVAGVHNNKEMERCGQFISIREILGNFVLVPDEIFNVCLAYDQFFLNLSYSGTFFNGMKTKGNLETNSTAITDIDTFACGDDGEIVFRIILQLFYDEIEPVNVIGLRYFIHKIVCFYWNLKNLPLWFLSDMKFKFVVTLVPYFDVKAFGLKKKC